MSGKSNTDAESDADVGHAFYADGGLHLHLIRLLLSLGSPIADQAVHELLDQDREIASLRARVRELRASHDADAAKTWGVSRENELFAIFECSKTAIAYTLDFLAAQMALRRSLCPTETDDALRTRLQRMIISELSQRWLHL